MLSLSDDRVTLCKLNDVVYITLERRAADVVRCEELLGLGGVVELLYEEVWNGVVRQAGDSRRRR